MLNILYSILTQTIIAVLLIPINIWAWIAYILLFGIVAIIVMNAQKDSSKNLTKDQQQEERVRNKKLLYFDQISKHNSKSSNKGKIDDISPKALSVIFDSEDLQNQIMGSIDNPLQKAHIVDVVVQTVASLKCIKSWLIMNL